MDSLYVAVPVLVLCLCLLATWLAMRRMVSLCTRSGSRWWKAAERIVLSLAILLAVGVAGNSTYSAIAIRLFLAANLPAGKMYSVNGHKMHLYCIGSGQPTIILETGLGPATDVLSWSALQPKLAETSRVCSYDRAGLGWSEPRAGPSDADQIASDLHDLLVQAHVSGPLVLIGTSYGGIYIRNYIGHYPAEVAGLVFIDSSTPFQQERFQDLARSPREASPAMRIAILHAEYLLGVPRVLGWCGRPVPGWESRSGRALGEDACIAHFEGVREFLSSAQSSAETARAGPFGALPILIFSRDPSKALSMPNPPRSLADRETLWNVMQEELKTLSTRSRRIIARGSGHGVCTDREDLVLREVRLFLDQIRGTTSQTPSYGSTIIE